MSWKSFLMPRSAILPVSAPMPAPMAMPAMGTRKSSPNSVPQNMPPSVPAATMPCGTSDLSLPSSSRQTTAARSSLMR